MRARPTKRDPALAAAVRHLREERGWTQEDLAHEAALTVAGLARVERGTTNPTWATVRQIAGAFELSMAEFGRAVDHEGRSSKSGRR